MSLAFPKSKAPKPPSPIGNFGIALRSSTIRRILSGASSSHASSAGRRASRSNPSSSSEPSTVTRNPPSRNDSTSGTFAPSERRQDDHRSSCPAIVTSCLSADRTPAPIPMTRPNVTMTATRIAGTSQSWSSDFGSSGPSLLLRSNLRASSSLSPSSGSDHPTLQRSGVCGDTTPKTCYSYRVRN